MVRRLEIWNHALIAHVQLNLEPGFHVFTGETGSGKSILLGAFGLMLGHRADTSSVGLQGERSVVEGDIHAPAMKAWLAAERLPEDQPILIRREILRNGRSRVFINDSQATAKQLKALGEHLVDLHRQDDTRDALDPDKQLQMLDKFVQDEGRSLRAYQEAHAQWKEASALLDGLRKQAMSPSGDADYLKHQLEQLSALNLDDVNWEKLQEEVQSLGNASTLTHALEVAMEAGQNDEMGYMSTLAEARKQLSTVAHVDSDLRECLERLESVRIELEDLLAEMEGLLERKAPDPIRLERLTQQADAIHGMMNKHRCASFEDLLDKASSMRADLEDVESLHERLVDAERHCNKAHSEMTGKGMALQQARQDASQTLASLIVPRLVGLKMPHASLEWTFEEGEPLALGMHVPALMFGANPGAPMLPIGQVASGGEKSRLMLAIKASVAQVEGTPVVVLDEIDTGVSGEVAAHMGTAMKDIVQGQGTQQVVAVTHLPQVAALADHHYEVRKTTDGAMTFVEVVKLGQDERTDAIAKMLSGSTITEEAKSQAQRLLEDALG